MSLNYSFNLPYSDLSIQIIEEAEGGWTTDDEADRFADDIIRIMNEEESDGEMEVDEQPEVR